ncbi:hypothetical protein DSO57_1030929 [Entomophthora muscae]|uniref:Uncharacterized protein n=1 Tax=Entomophthora muscae TaxID=34485 RepID=A0ACC2SDQ1_9FUNG|nr:hypothetical protein DSO57_1030929 [Entomophthora muscae]
MEETLIHSPEARTRETKTVYREGTKITIPPLLFCDKYNFLPAYLVPMTPPLTLQPDRPQESVATNESTSTQVFGVMHITLTGLIDSMMPVSRPWAVLGKLLSYIVKLAPILWWTLPAGPAGSEFSGTPAGWIPDTAPAQGLRLCTSFEGTISIPVALDQGALLQSTCSPCQALDQEVERPAKPLTLA